MHVTGRNNFTQVCKNVLTNQAIIRVAGANENGGPLKRVCQISGVGLLLSLFRRRVRRNTIL